MPQYLYRASYFPEVLQLVAEPARRAACEDLAGLMGGHIDSFHSSFGDDDLYFVARMPDSTVAAHFTAAVSRIMKTIRMVPLQPASTLATHPQNEE